ncbi:MAG: hypothetical protein QXL57_02430 [Candidatus Bathyarchaeia archaeon]
MGIWRKSWNIRHREISENQSKMILNPKQEKYWTKKEDIRKFEKKKAFK